MGRIKKFFVIECDESANSWLFGENLEELLNHSTPSGGPYIVSEMAGVEAVHVPSAIQMDNPIKTSSGIIKMAIGFTNLRNATKNLMEQMNKSMEFEKIKEAEELCRECSDKFFCYRKCDRLKDAKDEQF